MNPPGARLLFGPVTLIPDERVLLKNGQPVSLTPKAFDLLSVLASNPGRLLTKEQLMRTLWPDTVVEESNLTYHIFAIRKGLGEDGEGERYIETVPKRGYRFIAPVSRADADAAPAPTEGVTPSAGPSSAVVAPSTRRRSWVAVGVSLFTGAALVFGVLKMQQSPALSLAGRTAAVRFQDPVKGRLAESETFAVSEDGRRYVYAAEGPDGVLRLWLRTLDSPQPVAIPESEMFTIAPPPVWSPDSRFFAFNPAGVLRKGSVDGGMPQELCAFGTAVGGDWNDEGDILVGNAGDFGGRGGGLVLCSASGGPAAPVTTPQKPATERHVFPSFLSDGRRFIYLKVLRTDSQASGIFMGALPADVGQGPALRKDRLITTGFNASFVSSVDQRLPLIVFARDGSLFAQRFDEARQTTTGNAMRIADRVGSFLDGAFFSVSPTTLIYREPGRGLQLAWFDRRGRELARVGQPARYADLALSPHGSRILAAIHEPQGAPSQDLWLFELSKSGNPRKVSFDSEIERGLAWSTEDHFMFGSGAGLTGAYRQSLDGVRQRIFDNGGPFVPSSVSADRNVILYSTLVVSPPGGDIWIAIRRASGYVVKPLISQIANQSDARISPDGHWVAYISDETGPNEVFVGTINIDVAAGVATVSNSSRVSHGGGSSPRWSRDGRELLYLTGDGSVMALTVDSKSGVRPAGAVRLFTVRGALPQWDVSEDGRFLFAVPVAETPPFNIVRDWQVELPH